MRVKADIGNLGWSAYLNEVYLKCSDQYWSNLVGLYPVRAWKMLKYHGHLGD